MANASKVLNEPSSQRFLENFDMLYAISAHLSASTLYSLARCSRSTYRDMMPIRMRDIETPLIHVPSLSALAQSNSDIAPFGFCKYLKITNKIRASGVWEIDRGLESLLQLLSATSNTVLFHFSWSIPPGRLWNECSLLKDLWIRLSAKPSLRELHFYFFNDNQSLLETFGQAAFDNITHFGLFGSLRITDPDVIGFVLSRFTGLEKLDVQLSGARDRELRPSTLEGCFPRLKEANILWPFRTTASLFGRIPLTALACSYFHIIDDDAVDLALNLRALDVSSSLHSVSGTDLIGPNMLFSDWRTNAYTLSKSPKLTHVRFANRFSFQIPPMIPSGSLQNLVCFEVAVYAHNGTPNLFIDSLAVILASLPRIAEVGLIMQSSKCNRHSFFYPPLDFDRFLSALKCVSTLLALRISFRHQKQPARDSVPDVSSLQIISDVPVQLILVQLDRTWLSDELDVCYSKHLETVSSIFRLQREECSSKLVYTGLSRLPGRHASEPPRWTDDSIFDHLSGDLESQMASISELAPF